MAVVAGWGIGGIVSLLLVATIEGGILEPVGLGAEAGTSSWGLYLAAHPLAWGLITVIPLGWIGRRLVPGLRPGDLAALAVLVMGCLLAARLAFTVHEFVRARAFVFGVDEAGLAYVSVHAVVAVALLGWAMLAAPVSAQQPLAVLSLLAAAGFLVLVLPSLGGLADGISLTGVPVAWAMVGAGCFVAVIALLGARVLSGRAVGQSAGP